MKLYKNPIGLPQRCEPAGPGDIIAAFNELPLWTRVRGAAQTAQEVEDRGKAIVRPWEWPLLAIQWEGEDAEKAHRDTEIEELAKVIRSTTGRLGSWDSIMEPAREEYRKQARAVLDAGYRRGESAAPSPGLHDCEYDDPRMCAWPGHRKAQS